MAEYQNLGELFDDIADSIRGKTGRAAQIKAVNFPEEIDSIVTDPTGDATATAADILAPKTAYSQGSKITGTIPTKTASDLTAEGKTVTVPSGYYATQVTKNVSDGTAGTPTVSTSEVSNHSVTVSSSVTNTSGYIVGSTIPGGTTTIAASDLVSGNLATESEVNDQTSIDVTNYATISIQGMISKTTAETVTPTAAVQEILPASGKLLSKVTVNAVPYSEEDNPGGGLTVEIL